MDKETGKILTEVVALIGALIGGVGTLIKNKKDKNSRQQS